MLPVQLDKSRTRAQKCLAERIWSIAYPNPTNQACNFRINAEPSKNVWVEANYDYHGKLNHTRTGILEVANSLTAGTILRELGSIGVFPPDYERETVMDVLGKIRSLNEENGFDVFEKLLAEKVRCIKCFKTSVAEVIWQVEEVIEDVDINRVCLKCVKAGCELNCCQKERREGYPKEKEDG